MTNLKEHTSDSTHRIRFCNKASIVIIIYGKSSNNYWVVIISLLSVFEDAFNCDVLYACCWCKDNLNQMTTVY